MANSAFEKTIQELDALHAGDSRHIEQDGESTPRELWHAQQMSAWLERLKDSPNELLRIAVRGQHLQRWQVSRDEYEEGRQGYLHWRRDQGKRAGETTAARMRQAGYADDDAERVARMIRKEGLGRGGIRPGRGGLRLPRVPGELLCGLLEKSRPRSHGEDCEEDLGQDFGPGPRAGAGAAHGAGSPRHRGGSARIINAIRGTPDGVSISRARRKLAGVVRQCFQVVAAFLNDQGRQPHLVDRLPHAAEALVGDGNLRLRVLLVDVETKRDHQDVGLEEPDGILA